MYHRPRNMIHTPTSISPPTDERSIQVIQEINALEAYLAQPSLGDTAQHSVTFGPATVHTPDTIIQGDFQHSGKAPSLSIFTLAFVS